VGWDVRYALRTTSEARKFVYDELEVNANREVILLANTQVQENNLKAER